MIALALDVGGTNIRAAVVSRDMRILATARRPMDKSSREALLSALGDCAEEAAAGAAGAIGIGVAMKGFVDHHRGVMIGSANLGLKDVPVKAYLEKRLSLPTEVDNDVHAAAMGEIQYGAGRTYRHFLYVNVGTGIAVGMVLDGKLYRGSANLSGEFGHNTVDLDGAPCHCGLRGCLEEVVSGPGIEAWYRREAGGGADAGTARASSILAHAGGGDAAARRVLEGAARYLGTGIVNLANLFNPEAIILGGGVFDGAEGFVRLVADTVRSKAMPEIAACLAHIGVSGLEVGNVGILGAAGLVWERGPR